MSGSESERPEDGHGLVEAWRRQAAAAREWASGDDPEVVLEALAYTVALELTGDLARVPAAERDGLRKVGQRALLHLGGQDLDEDELEALRMCAAIARDGLRALSGRPIPDATHGADARNADARNADARSADARVLVPASEWTRLFRGELDGFAAGSLAMRARRSEAALAELRMLRVLSQPAERRIALAAADAAAVLDPAGGRPVGAHPALGVEAVLFEGTPRRLAVYAEEAVSLRLVAPELTTEDVREGYWIGRVAEGASVVEATLHAGERSERWRLELD